MPEREPKTKIIHGDCIEEMRKLDAESVDAVVTDPPYAEIDRDYGRLTEPDWHELMDAAVEECRRVLNPSGSAVFILQPNSERVGKMRLWLWEFVVRWGKRWGLVQDAYWWNHATAPTVHSQRRFGLLRPSMTWCVWLGEADCYRNQIAVLSKPSPSMDAASREDRALRVRPSGQSIRVGRIGCTVDSRGGSTPYNCLPIANTNSSDSAGSNGHGAGTPYHLAAWWCRYLCPPGGTVLDPFLGSGTTALACHDEELSCIGIEREADYVEIARRRLERHQQPRGVDLNTGSLFDA